MIVQHHPDDAVLTAFAAGTLDLGQQVAVATHLCSCAKCEYWREIMEQVGGQMLADLPPAMMANEALARIETRLNETAPPSERAPSTGAEIAGLPEFVHHYSWARWKWIAPRMYVRAIRLPVASSTRVFLLKSGPGTKMLPHSHSGVEMTCVLSGAFRHAGGYFGPGDFDFGDPTIDHRPIVEAGEDCICLVALQGQLLLNGLIGRIIQPFLWL
jgi:putative transcriptional regulator